ncbi:MAG: TonB-dependent receptor [Parahaliea sp.]
MYRMVRPMIAPCTICLTAAIASAPLVAQSTLEEVVVTATKREVGMQDVPIALSVVTGEKISEQGIGSLEDLTVYMPNVHIAEATVGDQLFIRGVGSGVNYGFEQSVGTFIDGIYFGRGQASRNAFLDIARVEVLKGPQSTLFGKNTIAGAINITTARPTDEFEAEISGSLEPKFDRWRTTLIASGPITEDFRMRAMVMRDESDGYVDNRLTGKDEPETRDAIARLLFDWKAADNLDLYVKYEHGESENRGRNNVISAASDLAIQMYRAVDPDFEPGFDYHKSSRSIGGVRPGEEMQDSEWDVGTLTLEWALGEHTLRSTTGYIKYEWNNYVDADIGPLLILGNGREEEHKQFSQEILLSSPLDRAVEYIAGVYYQSEDLNHYRYSDVVFSAIGVGGGAFDGTGTSDLQQDSKTLSAFTQVTWHITADLRVIGGLRYSKDQKELNKTVMVNDLMTTRRNQQLAGIYDGVLGLFTDHVFDGSGATVCRGVAYTCTFDPAFDNEIDQDQWTGDLTVQWDMNDDVMLYVKAATGYKAGGFDEGNSLGRTDVAKFDDETVEGLELGTKMSLWNGRARLNAAAFFNKFEDVQVSSFDGNIAFVVGNAAKSETMGMEVDGSIAVTDNLTLSGALAYLDTEYTNFPDAACSEPGVMAWIAAGGSRSTCVQDLKGQALQFAPDWSSHLSAEYFMSAGDSAELKFGLDAVYSDAYVVANDHDPAVDQDAYWKLSARIELSNMADIWSVALIGKNLTDEKTTTWGNDIPLSQMGFSGSYFQHIDPPRSVELQAKYRF